MHSSKVRCYGDLKKINLDIRVEPGHLEVPGDLLPALLVLCVAQELPGRIVERWYMRMVRRYGDLARFLPEGAVPLHTISLGGRILKESEYLLFSIFRV